MMGACLLGSESWGVWVSVSRGLSLSVCWGLALGVSWGVSWGVWSVFVDTNDKIFHEIKTS